MALKQAGRLVAALEGRGTGSTPAHELATALLETAPAVQVAAALIEGSLPDPAPKPSPTLRVLSLGTAAVLAAALGSRALLDMETLLPGGLSGRAFLPLVSLMVVVPVGLVTLVQALRTSSPTEGAEQRLVFALHRIGIEDDLARRTAGFVFEKDGKDVAPSSILEAINRDRLRLGTLRSGRVHHIPTWAMALAVVWSAGSFWVLYFLALGRSATVGAW